MAEMIDGPPSEDGLSDEREHILHAATETFLDLGYGAAALTTVADRVGLPHEQVRAHFPTKAALLVEATGREAQAFFASVIRSLGDEAPSSIVLTALIVELQSGPPLPMHTLLAETLVAAVRDSGVRRELAPHLRYVASAIGVVVRTAKRDGLVAADVDIDAVVYACLTLMFGSCVGTALGLDRPEQSQAESVIHKFVQGIGPPRRELDLRDPPVDGEAPASLSPASAPPPPRGS